MKRSAVFGLALLALGILLILRSLGFLWFSVGDLFDLIIPLGLIALGIWWILRNKQKEDIRRMAEHESWYRGEPSPAPETSADSPLSEASVQYDPSGKLRYSKFFGDLFIDCAGQDLFNVAVSSFFGDVVINVQGGRLRPGLNRLVISGFIGDLTITVPRDMPVFVHCSNFGGDINILGRHSSGFGNGLDAQTTDYDSAERKLYIAISQFIGDARVTGV